MKKHIFSFCNVIDNIPDPPSPIPFLRSQNDDIQHTLSKYKNMIGEYYLRRCWDKYKKIANVYELVSTHAPGFPSIAPFETISRSYFKLWEILHDFEDVLKIAGSTSSSKTPPPQMKCAFLAEGPGGFVESFVKYRQTKSGITNPDILYGMTLSSLNKAVPNWKLARSFLESNNITLLWGKDNTGNLYNHDNITSIVDTIGRNTCDFVTADGGFDFSNDFNVQEDVSAMLIAAEIATALQLQKQGGTCIIKIFDVFSPVTIALIAMLTDCYTKTFVTKPNTSRPANSEKYILCTGFKHVTCPQNITRRLYDAISRGDTKIIGEYPVRSDVMSCIIEMNKYMASKQIISIAKTICLIESELLEDDSENNLPALHGLIKEQLEYTMRWCHRYGIKFSDKAIAAYKSYLCDGQKPPAPLKHYRDRSYSS